MQTDNFLDFSKMLFLSKFGFLNLCKSSQLRNNLLTHENIKNNTIYHFNLLLHYLY